MFTPDVLKKYGLACGDFGVPTLCVAGVFAIAWTANPINNWFFYSVMSASILGVPCTTAAVCDSLSPEGRFFGNRGIVGCFPCCNRNEETDAVRLFLAPREIN